MMDNRYREELDGIRLTGESKRDLARALAARQGSKTTRRWSRTAIAAAVIAAVLAGTVGAAVVLPPVVRNYFGDSAGYRQSAVELGQSITQNGWTLTLTDCLADDYTIYLGVTLTAPEGTVLDWADGYFFDDWDSPTFPELDMASSGSYQQLYDSDPTDNQLSFIFTGYYIPEEKTPNGQTMEITLGGLYHNAGWSGGTEYSYEKIFDCKETWSFRTTLNYPDHVIHLEPNAAVHTLDVDATIAEVVVSPLSVSVCIEGDALKGHHNWVAKNAPDGWYGCVEYQDITLYTKDGTAIPMMDNQACSGCSGGTDPTEDGWIHLVRRPDTPLDVENLASISICGVEIPLK